MRNRIVAVATVWMTILSTGAGHAQSERQVIVEPEYRGGEWYRRVLGAGYRDLWITPVTLPVLDLNGMAGGLKPVRVVGQLQSLGLAFIGADGRSYTFRSLHKHPERVLPEEWRDRLPERIVRDQTSHLHPAAAVILPTLAEAAGVPHTTPRLVVVPDDPALGEFRAQFANQIGTIEEFPLPAGGGNPGFLGATAIVSTRELWDRWMEGPEHHIDQRAFLRARILDLWIDNYDRHRGQWRWMRRPGRPSLEPLPEDPDMAFIHHDGLLMTWLRGRMPHFLEFSEKYPSKLDGPVRNAMEVDRWLLSALSADDWQQEATGLAERFTDEVIERAVRNQPPEWFAINGPAMIDALKTRRASLASFAMQLYGYYAEKVDVHATDRNELVTVSRSADDTLEVAVAIAGQREPWFRRRFIPRETTDVRIYLHGGEDRVTRIGPAGGPIRVRVIAGGGADLVDDSLSGGTEIWRDAGTVAVREGRGTHLHEALWTNPTPNPDAPWIERRSFGHWTIPGLVGGIASDVGLVLGYGVTRRSWDFRTEPNHSEQRIQGAISTGRLPGKGEYIGTFRRAASHVAWRLHLYGSSIERHDFFGFGNDTSRETSPDRYRSFENEGFLSPTVRYERGQRLEMYAGPEVRYSSNGGTADTILREQNPVGVGRFGSIAVRGGFAFDSRMPSGVDASADLFAGPVEPRSRASVGGVRVQTSGFVVPTLWDVDSQYGGVDGMVAGYLGKPRAHVALRLGGRKMWGEYAWFDAAYTGGSNNRGFNSHRYTGDASLFGSVSLNTWLGNVDTAVFPIRFGLTGFVDSGRVWLEGETSDTWHTSAGGGALAQPLGLPFTFHALVGKSREGVRFYFGAGYPF